MYFEAVIHNLVASRSISKGTYALQFDMYSVQYTWYTHPDSCSHYNFHMKFERCKFCRRNFRANSNILSILWFVVSFHHLHMFLKCNASLAFIKRQYTFISNANVFNVNRIKKLFWCEKILKSISKLTCRTGSL